MKILNKILSFLSHRFSGRYESRVTSDFVSKVEL